ncbi:MAG: amidohydrolase family protein [Candidatus Pacebacteria bacterium]|nr:amidohydrolase family protein [Candidatus Paceibacterota bacterium]
MTNCFLVHDEHVPDRARFPVVDAHNHLWAAWEAVDKVVDVMDEVGVACYCDLTTNIRLQWAEGGYVFQPGDISDFFNHAVTRYPHRFYGFTMASLARPVTEPLFRDAGDFVEECVATLNDHVRRGARGLKVLKELGLRYRDGDGNLIHLDDERLAPIWEEAGRLGVPVLMHQSDPVGFFQPVRPENEHYDSLQKYPSWSFFGPEFPSKKELIERRDRVVRNHPGTTFLLPHVANYAEDLAYVGALLDRNPNVFIDFSARCDELGRQPYSAREFLITYQDRVYFGTDMPASVEMYRFYFRFLETCDEYFIPPDYDGTFGRHRWRVHGLGLPDDVLRKIYFANALDLIPGLRQDYDLNP